MPAYVSVHSYIRHLPRHALFIILKTHCKKSQLNTILLISKRFAIACVLLLLFFLLDVSGIPEPAISRISGLVIAFVLHDYLTREKTDSTISKNDSSGRSGLSLEKSCSMVLYSAKIIETFSFFLINN